MGPSEVSWNGRTIAVDLGYRGPLWVPDLGSTEWWEPRDENWQRFRRTTEASFRSVRGVLFVADSQRARQEANLERVERLERELQHVGRDKEAVVVLFALNKQDLAGRSDLTSTSDLRSTLTWPVCEHIETSARNGIGVEQAVDRLLRMVDADGS